MPVEVHPAEADGEVGGAGGHDCNLAHQGTSEGLWIVSHGMPSKSVSFVARDSMPNTSAGGKQDRVIGHQAILNAQGVRAVKTEFIERQDCDPAQRADA